MQCFCWDSLRQGCAAGDELRFMEERKQTYLMLDMMSPQEPSKQHEDGEDAQGDSKPDHDLVEPR